MEPSLVNRARAGIQHLPSPPRPPRFHTAPPMAPLQGIDTNRIKDSALKDLLDLLEGVSSFTLYHELELLADHQAIGPRKESPLSRSKLERPHRTLCKVLRTTGSYQISAAECVC